MLEPPFALLSCSWPRPVEQANGRWLSEPEWDAPRMPDLPRPRLRSVHGEPCWMVDWGEWFGGGLQRWDGRQGEMRNFQVVFRLRIARSGTLIFWDDDGSIIRRSGEVIHRDRSLHPLTRHEVAVIAAEELEVAQWQAYGGWLWGAFLTPTHSVADPAAILSRYLSPIQARLREPNGPPLKLFCDGRHPVRTTLALYSLLLNGYRPSRVLVFGEHQWAESSRKLFAALIPFAEIVPANDVLHRFQTLALPRLTDWAGRYWFVMKTCVSVLYPPDEFCLMDDDVFILRSTEEALQAFQSHNLVYAQDADYGKTYAAAWGGGEATARLGTFNEGLYWLRNRLNARDLAARLLRVSPDTVAWHVWGQGFVASAFANESAFALPAQRFFYPYVDGLPGGFLGYDYARNPCGFVSVHFGGLTEKPSDAESLLLASGILGAPNDDRGQ